MASPFGLPAGAADARLDVADPVVLDLDDDLVVLDLPVAHGREPGKLEPPVRREHRAAVDQRAVTPAVTLPLFVRGAAEPDHVVRGRAPGLDRADGVVDDDALRARAGRAQREPLA